MKLLRSYLEFDLIGYLKGSIKHRDAEKVILSVGNIGYEVEIPASTLFELKDKVQDVELFIYTHVREDSIRLFGFISNLDKAVFVALIAVSGVGPKAALTLLGAARGEELIPVILSGNKESLKAIPGIGLKTAERLILELKSSFEKLYEKYKSEFGSQSLDTGLDSHTASHDAKNQNSFPHTEDQITTSGSSFQLIEDLKSALKNLGYKEKNYAALISEYQDRISKGDKLSLEFVLKDSLRRLSNNLF